LRFDSFWPIHDSFDLTTPGGQSSYSKLAIETGMVLRLGRLEKQMINSLFVRAHVIARFQESPFQPHLSSLPMLC
jgi:hypothetical protein